MQASPRRLPCACLAIVLAGSPALAADASNDERGAAGGNRADSSESLSAPPAPLPMSTLRDELSHAPAGRSPFADPPPALDRALEDFGTETGGQPLWTLPPAAIPPQRSALPGQRLTRQRGFLDTPDTITGAGRADDSLRAAELHQGLAWEYCGPRPASLGPREQPPPAQSMPVDIDAGALAYQQDSGVLDLRGGVDVRRGGQRVRAERLRYDRDTSELSSEGETLLERPGLRIIGGAVRYNLDTEQGRIEDPRYRISGTANLRGDAALAELLDPSRTRYSELLYTSCPPGDNAWSLRASELRLDQDTGRGVARNARLRIKGVPVLYTPYLNFPIDDRRMSGFLIPSVGTSDDRGFELETPYYWNIAPNMDATLSPRYMSERGLMLGSEFRYLTANDTGTVNAEILPADAEENDETRWAVRLEQNGRFFQRFSTLLDYSEVSDDTYLEDFGNGLDITSTRHLVQRGRVGYSGRGWTLQTELAAFQTVDQNIAPRQRPFERLPQVLFNTAPIPFGPGLVGRLNAEYDFFEHDDLTHGQRVSLQPTVALPLRRSYGHLIPRAYLNANSYHLTDTEPGQPRSPGHVIPTVEVDGKLVFERDFGWFGERALQTLEPRLFYLYTPFEDQSESPVFDSSALDFSFTNLFRSNRFTGRDRIGDANQVTTALSSRILSARSGAELLRLSVGRILYFSNRRVQIDGPVQTDDASPIAAEMSASLFDEISARASFEWDPDLEAPQEEEFARRTVQLRYQDSDSDQLLNLAYRFDRGTSRDTRFEDTDVSFRLPLGGRVEMVGRWLYSLENEQTTDAFAGVEFGQCCWKVRVVGRHFKNRADSPASTSVMVQLELAGLGAFGSSVDRFLEREIYGYRTD